MSYNRFLMRSFAAGIACCAIVAGPALRAQPGSGTCFTCGVLTGQVIDEGGRPIVGATVRVLGTNRGGYSMAPSGRFRLPSLESGECRIEVRAAGYETRAMIVRINAADPNNIRVRLSEIDLPIGYEWWSCPIFGSPRDRGSAGRSAVRIIRTGFEATRSSDSSRRLGGDGPQ
jgi:hypothetical protein